MSSERAFVYSAETHEEVKIFDVEYRKDGKKSWLATVFQPQGEGPYPALLFVHGGLWSGGDRAQGSEVNRQLAESGLVVVSIDFGVAPEYPYPEQVAATNFATRWLKVHAHEFNASSNRVGGMGASSGGHTIMLSAMRPHDSRYESIPLEDGEGVDATLDYVVTRYPVIDPYARHQYAKESGKENLVKAAEGYFLTEAAMREGNPQTMLERGETVAMPPILIIQGTEDANVPKSIPDRFADAYRIAGGSVDLHWFRDAEHLFDLKESPDTERAIASMKRYIAQRLALAAPAVS